MNKTIKKYITVALAALAAVAVMFTAGCNIKSRQAFEGGDEELLRALGLLSDSANASADSADRYRLAQDHFIIARDYERRGFHEAAFELYEAAYGFWPYSSFLRKIVADEYMRRNRYDMALALFSDTGLSALTPDELRTLSAIYRRLGNMEKAAEAIEALGGERTDEEMYSLAMLYEAMGRKDKAFKSFRDFFAGSPRSAELGVKMVQLSVGERHFADAESLAVILRSVRPNDAAVAALLGTIKYLGRDTVSAVALFNEALKQDSLNEDALRTLAHIWLVKERYPEAIALYKRLTALGSVAPVYRRGLAFLLFHAKEYAAAEKIFDELILADDDGKDIAGKPELHLYRGLVYSQTKRIDRADSEFRAALALDPRYEEAWKELCYIYILAKDKEKANRVVDEYTAAFPNSAQGWRFRGYVLNMREKHDEAVAALKKATEIDPTDYYSWFEIGSILEKRKRIDEAAAAFGHVLRIHPGDAQAANYLGYMWAEAGMMLDSAKALIEAALKKDPDNGAYLDSYAWVFYQMGDYEKALHYMNRALEQESVRNDPVPYEHIGDIYFKLSDYRAAEGAYKRSLELKTEDAKRIKERLGEIKNLMRGKKGQ
ncbi:MAG: tetratricopeptide repeat protein [Chitinispirillales bacterium]|jgi:tetratricopeptide (TPR) repeat protein|nr:tetratricopeptide repeat protein [Chitinispirillales bacterium]